MPQRSLTTLYTQPVTLPRSCQTQTLRHLHMLRKQRTLSLLQWCCARELSPQCRVSAPPTGSITLWCGIMAERLQKHLRPRCYWLWRVLRCYSWLALVVIGRVTTRSTLIRFGQGYGLQAASSVLQRRLKAPTHWELSNSCDTPSLWSTAWYYWDTRLGRQSLRFLSHVTIIQQQYKSASVKVVQWKNNNTTIIKQQ